MRAPRPQDAVAVILTITIALVLIIIVLDLILATAVDELDRSASLVSLGTIGTALALGLAGWLRRTASPPDPRPPAEPEPERHEPPGPEL